jgi:tripartite-type tricarboxylate transporter receptor subunit TctC
MLTKSIKVFLSASVIAGIGLLPCAASADSVADFYKGKTVTVYIGFSPGGGYDANGRLLARHIGRFIPGNPDVVAKNLPGAASGKLMTYFSKVAPKDGTEFGIVGAETALMPLFRKETVGNYDTTKLSWIGSLNSFTTIGIAMAKSGLASIEDAKKKQFFMASVSPGSSTSVYAKMLNDMVGTKFKIVHGYKGSKGMSLSMEQGETVGFFGWCWSCINANRPDWIKKNVVNVFLQFGLKKNPELKGVPWIFDVLKTEEEKAVARAILASLGPARPFVGPPNLPKDRLEALRTAFMKLAQDPQFLADAKRAKRPIRPMPGKVVQKTFQSIYNFSPKVIERAASYYK